MIYSRSCQNCHHMWTAEASGTPCPECKTPFDPSPNRQFDTGAQRNQSAGKGRCDLLPFSALLAVSKHYEAGAQKFGDANWTKGMPQNVLLDSCLRHLMQYARGDQDEDHLLAALWNCLGLVEQRERFAAGTLDAGLNTVPVKPK